MVSQMTMNGNARTYTDVIQNVRSQIVLNFYTCSLMRVLQQNVLMHILIA